MQVFSILTSIGRSIAIEKMKSALASISEYLKEWLTSVSAIRDAATTEEMMLKLSDFAHLPILSDGNFVNKSGYEELRSAARRILIEAGDELKLVEDTAINAILYSQKEEIEILRSGRKFSEHRLLSRAKKIVEKTARMNGIFVVPLFLAPESKETNFEVGPVRLLSARCFAKEPRGRILAAASLDGIAKSLCDDWIEYSAKFDHFILVNIVDHDLKCGMATAYRSATVLVNLMRTFFGYHHTKNVRISGDFIRENYISYVVIQDIGDVAFGTSWAPRASHLDDAAIAEFFKYIDGSKDFFGRLIDWISRTGRSSAAIFDRIIYANELLSEAYGEPNSKIKIVRLIAAL